MKNLSRKNFKLYFLSYIPALLILGLGSSLINVVLKIKQRMDEQLHKNVAGIDALVGAKGSPIQLTLANIYHLDDPTGNIPYEKALQISKNPMLASAIPLAYGDNLQRFRILGTTNDYLKHFGAKLENGTYITQPLEVILGYDVAKKLNIGVGFTFHSMHGNHDGHLHEENEYRVIGVLQKNNSVVDKLVITSIASLWQTHNQGDTENYFDSISFANSAILNKQIPDFKEITADSKEQNETHIHEHEDEHDHEHEHETGEENEHEHEHEHENEKLEEEHSSMPKDITALLLKFRGPAGLFMIRQLNEDPDLMAVNPAQTVLKFFTVLGVGYQTVESIGIGVIFIAIITLMLTLIQVFQGRKQELALLRVMGASKFKISRSLIGEVFMIVFFGFCTGFVISFLTLELLSIFVEKGIFDGFQWQFFGKDELSILFVCLFCGMVSVSIPLIKVYRIDISKTLTNEA